MSGSRNWLPIVLILIFALMAAWFTARLVRSVSTMGKGTLNVAKLMDLDSAAVGFTCPNAHLIQFFFVVSNTNGSTKVPLASTLRFSKNGTNVVVLSCVTDTNEWNSPFKERALRAYALRCFKENVAVDAGAVLQQGKTYEVAADAPSKQGVSIWMLYAD